LKKGSPLGLVLILFFAVFASFFGNNSAFAASDWDNALNPTPSLVLKNSAESYSQDVTTSYMSLLQDNCPTYV